MEIDHDQRQRLAAPISRLPSQLLSRIFLYNVWSDRLHDKRCETLKTIHRVCTHWHKVALGFPTLWSRSISFERDHPRYTRKLLDLSHPAPLDVEVTLSIHDKLDPTGANVSLAFEHLPRIRVLRLWMPEIHLTKVLPALDRPAPALESLSLRNNDYQRTCHLPPLFADQTPKLHTLDIRSCTLDWDSLLLSNLTHLTIHEVPPVARPSWTRLFSVLSSMSMLELLSLENTIPACTAVQQLGDRSVTLAHLSQFRLADNITACAYFTSCLVLPSNIVLYLRSEDTVSDIDASDILAWLHTRLDGMIGKNTLQDVSIHSEGYHFGLLGWITTSENNEILPPIPLDQPQIEIHFYFQGKNDHNISRLIAATCDSLECPLNQVKSLEVSNQAIHIPTMAWPALLRPFTSVRALYMDDPPYSLFAELTKSQMESGGSAEGTQGAVSSTLLPALQKIRFSSPDFEVDEIITYLRLRLEKGMMIKEVLLEYCDDLATEDVYRMRGLVDSVIWTTEDVQEEDDNDGGDINFSDIEEI